MTSSVEVEVDGAVATVWMVSSDGANECIRRLHETRLVTIAAVHGAAVGGGLALTLAADVALAAEGTVFSVGYAAIGATPDMGTSFFLTRALGYRRAFELYFSSERFDARRALELGLVNRVLPAAELVSAF